MESDARYTWVGAVVVALVAALVGAVLWLRNVGDNGQYLRYVVHFEHQKLDGLEVGAEVTLRGIRVGRVEDYGLMGTDLKRVRVQLRVDRRAALRTNTVAVVTRNIVTGIAAITLVSRDPPGELLQTVPEGETYPVVAEGRSEMEEIAGRVNKIGESLTIAVGNLNQLLASENRDTLMGTIRNLGELAAGLQQRLGSMERSLSQLGNAATRVGEAAVTTSTAVTQIGGAAASVGAAASTLGQAGQNIAAAAASSAQRLDATLVASERAVAEAQKAFARVAEASEALQRQTEAAVGRLERSAGNVDDQLAAAVTELRLSVEASTRVLDRLREPRAALLGPGKGQLGPGEKAP